MVQILHSQKYFWEKRLRSKDCKDKRKCDLRGKEIKNKGDAKLWTSCES